jgi:hypothetical protein
MHPLNLALRFFLEVAALGGFGVLAWRSSEGGWRYLTVIAVLALLMTLWGVFAVPGDPSRSGNAPVPVSGSVRLVLELAVLLGGAGAFYWAGHNLAAFALAALVLIHYALSGERIAWLLQQ